MLLTDIEKADKLLDILFPDQYRHVKYEFSTWQGERKTLYTVYLEDYGHKTSPTDFREAIMMLIKDGRLTPNE
jgi:hypothetical protein